jgi:myo-inositol-1(or 4)-monophosphatase
MDLNRIMEVATDAAYKSAHLLQSYFGGSYDISSKGARDLITEADTASERIIGETIARAFPGHSILAEEGGLSRGDSKYRWLVDPLDGTINFAHGLTIFAVSIAFELAGDVTAGIVLNPVTGEFFSAAAGKGARLNDHPIRVSTVNRLPDSLLATGLIYDTVDHLDPLMTRFRAGVAAALGVRRLGSAALDLCFLACGRFDGYWEENLKPWDTAAGALIASEAGATLSDFSNQPYRIEKKQILATNGRIHRQMLSTLQI